MTRNETNSYLSNQFKHHSTSIRMCYDTNMTRTTSSNEIFPDITCMLFRTTTTLKEKKKIYTSVSQVVKRESSFIEQNLSFMFFLTDINSICLFFIFITRTDRISNHQFIHLINDSRPKVNKFLPLFTRRTGLFSPVNSTIRKHLGLYYHLKQMSWTKKLARKRREGNQQFKSESLKYYTCALVSN